MSYSGEESSVGNKKAQRRRRTLTMMIIVASCAFAWFMGTTARRVGVKNARLVVPEEYLNIGDVWEDNNYKWTIPVQNNSNKDINVKKFIVSCSCVSSIEPKSAIIPMEKRVDVQIVFDLTGRSAEQIDSKERPFEVSLLALMESDGVQYRSGWAIRGKIQSRITVNPLVLYTGNVRKGELSTMEPVTVSVHVPIKDLLLDYNRNELKIKKTQLSSGEGMKKFLLDVNISDNLPIGAFKSPIKIRVVDSEGKTHPGTQLYVEGVSVDDIEAIPSLLVLGCGSIKEHLGKEVVLRSYRGAAVKIDDVLIPSQDLIVEPIKSGFSSCPSYKVTQKVTKTGDQSSVLRFICHSTLDPRPVTLEIPVCYRGLPERTIKPP